jgi:hypothetical protein
MTDIVERLRKDDVVWGVRPSLAFEAADEIEKLREERNRLREALGTIVATKSVNEINPHADAKMMWVGCIQIADAALKEKE